MRNAEVLMSIFSIPGGPAGKEVELDFEPCFHQEHLRNMVCNGQLDRAAAQRDMAANWIEAYKKYFHTDRPLTAYR
jgi:hypothetical protein